MICIEYINIRKTALSRKSKYTVMNFMNKVVIITGASAGIGKSTAICFAKKTAHVVIVGRNEQKLNEAEKAIRSKGHPPLVIKADVTNDCDVKKIVDETVKRFGQIDVVVNNAGSGIMATLKDGIAAYDHMMNTNLRSAYLLTHLALPYLIRSKGNIVNVSSIAAFKPVDDLMAYCISKAGMDMLTKAAAVELGPKGIRVNSVNPGPTKSEFFDRLGIDNEQKTELMGGFRKDSPLDKHVTEEEVAKLITYLASDDAKSITGSHFVIDNGYAI